MKSMGKVRVNSHTYVCLQHSFLHADWGCQNILEHTCNGTGSGHYCVSGHDTYVSCWQLLYDRYIRKSLSNFVTVSSQII